MRLCLERILAPCRQRTVKFALPPIESAADIAAAMKAVTSALAGGRSRRRGGHRSRRSSKPLCGFVRAIKTSDFYRRLQELKDRFKPRAEAGMVGTGWVGGHFNL